MPSSFIDADTTISPPHKGQQHSALTGSEGDEQHARAIERHGAEGRSHHPTVIRPDKHIVCEQIIEKKIAGREEQRFGDNNKKLAERQLNLPAYNDGKGHQAARHNRNDRSQGHPGYAIVPYEDETEDQTDYTLDNVDHGQIAMFRDRIKHVIRRG